MKNKKIISIVCLSAILVNASILANNKTITSNEVVKNVKLYANHQNTNDKNIITKTEPDKNKQSQSTKFLVNQNSASITDPIIDVKNNTQVPVFSITINPKTQELQASEYSRGNNYTGIFDGRNFSIKLINPSMGNVLKSFEGTRLNDSENLVSEINNTKYSVGDILEIQSNSKYVPISLLSGKNTVKNNIENEYYKITENGLVDVTKSFIPCSGLDILGTNNVNKFSLTGKIKPNTNIKLEVNGKSYNTVSNSDGEYTFNLSNLGSIDKDTSFMLSTEGYLNTEVNPTINNKINIQNSYINFYNSQGYKGGIGLSIGFNPASQKFDCYNYGYTNEKNVRMILLNQYGKTLYNNEFNVNTIGNAAEIFNNMNFNYGDIIGLSYTTGYSIPTISSENNVMGNVDGNLEYFEITQDGLVPVQVGEYATTNNLTVSNDELNINLSLVKGQSKEALEATKKLVLLDKNGKVITSSSLTQDTDGNLQGTISLSGIQGTDQYELGIEVGNILYKVLENSNIYGSDNYTVQTNSQNIVSVSKAKPLQVNITSSQDIENYLNTLNNELDENLTINNADNMDSNLMNLVISRQFLRETGIGSLQAIYKLANGPEFINWLLNNEDAMNYFIQGVYPGYINSTQLTILYNIYNTYTNSRWGFNLKLAVATAIAEPQSVSNPVAPSWWDGGSPVERYNIFQNLYASGGLLPGFSDLNMRILVPTVKTDLPNSQIMLTRGVMLENHNGLVSKNQLVNTVNTMNYNEYNPYTGASVQRGGFYGQNPSMYTVWRDGGVCGALSKTSVAASNVFGIPAIPIGQPGHCAFEYYGGSSWEIGNNIFGWNQSSGGDYSGWSKGGETLYTVLYSAAIKKGNLEESNKYLWLDDNISVGQSVASYSQKLAATNKAISLNPLNLEAYKEKLSLYESNPKTTGAQYAELGTSVVNNFKEYPQPMFDFILKIKDKINSLGTATEKNEFSSNLINALKEISDGDNADEGATIAGNYLNNLSSYGIQNSKELGGQIYLNDWGKQNTVNINLVSGNLIVTGSHTWIGSDNSDYLEVNLYNSDGVLLKHAQATGETFADYQYQNDFAGLLNRTPYTIGDYITVSYKSGQASHSSLGFKNSNGQNSAIGDNALFQITNNGLEKVNQNYINTPQGKYVFFDGQLNNTEGMISLNTWGVNSNVNLNFTQGKIKATGQHKWIASSNNGYLELNLYNSQGVLEKHAKATGEEFGSNQPGDDFTSQINGTQYSIGDIVTLQYQNNGEANGTLSFTNQNGQKEDIPDTVAYEITLNGLVPLSNYYIYDNNKVFSTANGVLTPLEVSNPSLSVSNVTITEDNDFENSLINAKTDSGNILTYSGSVNINKPGNYNVVVTAKNKYGLTTSKTAVITVVNPNSLYSNIENAYYDNNSLVINGNLDEDIKSSMIKNLVIEENNQIIEKINTVPVNWYSKNKENYSGYQAVISEAKLENLKISNKYNLGIECEGKIYKLKFNGKPIQKNGYQLNQVNGEAQLSKLDSNIVTNENSICKNIYTTNNGIIINAKLNLTNIDLTPATQMKISIINSKNQQIYSGTGIAVNWYSANKSIYNGVQVFIPFSELDSLNSENKYKLEIKLTSGNTTYEMPINSSYYLNVNNNYTIAPDSTGNLILSGNTKTANTATGSIKEDYMDGTNEVLNVKFNIPNMSIQSRVNLKILNNQNKTETISGELVNWYGSKISEYNGAQFIINENEIPKDGNLTINVESNNKSYNVKLMLANKKKY